MGKGKIKEYLIILVGTALMAVGIQSFLEPARLVAGGITGLGIMLNGITSEQFGHTTPLWLINIVLNLPLLAWAWRKAGIQYVSKTFVTSMTLSVMLFFVENISFYTGDKVLAAMYGGVFIGVGMGLVLRGGASTGGTDLAASLIQRTTNRGSLASKIFAIDAAVILLGMLVFGGTSGLYAILSVFISERCNGYVLEGMNFSRGAFIISDKPEEVADALMKQLGRGVTSFEGKGAFTGQPKQILLCVFSQKEVHLVKSVIMEIDEDAFFMVSDIREVLGEGFSGK